MEGLKVRDIMINEVTTLKRNDKLTIANDIMELGRIRHLPVLEDDSEQLIGIVSQRDLFRGALAHALGYGQHAQRKVLDTLLVKEVMSSDVLTTTPDTPLIEAARILTQIWPEEAKSPMPNNRNLPSGDQSEGARFRLSPSISNSSWPIPLEALR